MLSIALFFGGRSFVDDCPKRSLLVLDHLDRIQLTSTNLCPTTPQAEACLARERSRHISLAVSSQMVSRRSPIQVLCARPRGSHPECSGVDTHKPASSQSSMSVITSVQLRIHLPWAKLDEIDQSSGLTFPSSTNLPTASGNIAANVSLRRVPYEAHSRLESLSSQHDRAKLIRVS